MHIQQLSPYAHTDWTKESGERFSSTQYTCITIDALNKWTSSRLTDHASDCTNVRRDKSCFHFHPCQWTVDRVREGEREVIQTRTRKQRETHTRRDASVRCRKSDAGK